MSKRTQSGAPGGLDRRSFFKTAALGGASTLAVGTGAAVAMNAPPARAAVEPSAAAMDREAGPPRHEPGLLGRSGGDYMVDAIKQLGIPYVATMPGSSFRGLHEALIGYGGNKAPEILTCLHEEVSVALAHGYAKVAGKPIAVMLHGTVGVQHGAMAIYNAWCDRAPILMFGGNTLDGTKRRAGVEWNHSVLDQGAMTRDFVKWDAQPISLPDFNEALKRGYQLSVSAPSGPVLLMLDGELQENPIPADLKPEPLLGTASNPVGDPAMLEAAAKALVAASNPVIVVDRMVRSPEGMARLVELAELLQAPVVDRNGRLNMPTTHYLCQTGAGGGLIRQADVILGLELTDPWGTLNSVVDVDERHSERITQPNVRMINLSTRDFLVHSNYQDFQRWQPVELSIAGDPEASMPYLVEAVRRALDAGARARIEARGPRLRTAYDAMKKQAAINSTYGWDASPISTGRMTAELWRAIRDEDWALCGGGGGFQGSWAMRLWDFTAPHQHIGGSGGGGVGYATPAAVGAALAHKDHGRLSVAIVGDGDILCTPTAMWTAAHHKIPLLTVVHNNRAYHQEVMHIQRLADRRSRGMTQAHIGTAIDNPDIDHAAMARSMGVAAVGPIRDAKDLAAGFERAVEIVKRGEPVLVDVVSQGR
jgi:thiamine pyrophosphate-dependent acetolactate synthase large subunit-like protein